MHKQRTFLTLLAVLLALPFGARAQDTLTVCDSTASSYALPLQGSYVDHGFWSEVVYPEDVISEMVGGNISSMVFYASTVSSTTTSYQNISWGGTFYVYLGPATASSYPSSSNSSWLGGDDLTLVYEGNLAVSNYLMEIELDEPYAYDGGDLCLRIIHQGGEEWITCYFFGVQTTTYQGASRTYTGSSQQTTYTTAEQFLPKCTFTYEGGGDVCRKVKGLTAEASATSIDLGWVDTTNTGATYTVQVINGTDTAEHANLSGTSYTATGLAANTMYKLRVKTTCSDESESGWASISTRTLCDDIALPWFEDFESNVNNQVTPFCWTDLSYPNGSSTNYHYITTYGHNGLGYYFYPYGKVFLVSQQLPADADQLEISFWANVSNYATLQMGLMSDPTDTTTFRPLTVIQGNGNTWREYVAYSDTCTLEGHPYLAFRAYASNGYSIYVDDINVAVATDCRRVTSLSVGEIGHYTATLSWVPGNDQATGYEVRWSTNNNVNTAQAQTGITDTTYELTGLLPYTQYYAWVRALCGQDTTAWCQLPTYFYTNRSCYPVTGLAASSVNYSSAQVSWHYDGNGRGLDETGVHLTLSDATGVVREWDVEAAEGSNIFVAGLAPGTSYTLAARTFCDPDTATAATVSFSTNGCGEVTTADNGTTYTGSSYSYPIYGYYATSSGNNYASVSQMLYPASAVSGLPSITGISFEVASAYYTANITADIYMAYTNKSAFSSASDYIDTSLFTCVGRNVEFATGTSGWADIVFDTPFATNGNGQNIAVMVYTKSVTSTNSYPYIYWRYHYSSSYDYQMVYSYGSASSYNNAVALLNNYNAYRSYYRPHIRFNGQCDLTCLAPNLRLEGTDVHSADLRWARGLDESQWAVQYRTEGDTAWTDAPAASDTTCTVGGLAARTHYYFRVGSICTDDTLWSNLVDEYTGCEALTELPYTEGFEGMPANRMALCWSGFSTSSSTNIYISTSHHNGQQSLYTYPYGTTYIVSPQMPEGTNPAELEVNWWGYYGGTSFRYEVGIMTDPADTNTFRTIFSTPGNNGMWTDYTAYADTVSYTSSDPIYIAFRTVGSANTMYIDDVVVRVATCKRPNGVHSTALTHNSATLVWNGMEGASYEYCLTTSPTQPADTVATQTTADTTATISGLEGNTMYFAWVRSICADEATPWSATYWFRSLCAPEELPFIENFNNSSEWSNGSFNVCWSRYSGAWGTTPTLTQIASTSTDAYLFNIPSSYGSSNNPFATTAIKCNVYDTYKTWFVSPQIHIATPAALSFEVALSKYYSSAAPTFDNTDREMKVAVSTDGGNTWTSLATWGTGEGYDYAYNTLSRTPQNVALPLNYTDQTILVAFYSGANSSGDDNELFIDNIEIQSADCMRPTNVHVLTSPFSATFDWTDISTDNEAGYVLVVNTANSATGATAMSYEIGAGDTTFTVSDLTPTTTYYYFLRSACTETVSNGSWTTGHFRTPCTDLVMPLDDDFEGYESYSFPDCWNMIEANDYSNAPYVYNYGGERGKVLYLYGYNYDYYYSTGGTMIISTPRIPVPLNEIEITFDAYGSSSYYPAARVYAGTNPDDSTTWHLLGTISNNGWNAYEYSTSELDVTDTGYIIFTGTMDDSYYTNNYVDNLFITVANPCRRTASVSASNITPYTADLGWPGVEGAAGYRVKYSQQNDIVGADSMDVSTNSSTLTGLQNGTTYYVWVQTLCADGISDPRSANFTTEISCYPISNVHTTGVSMTSTALMWDVDTRGNDAVSVTYTLSDITNGVSVVDSGNTNGLNHHLFSALESGHKYRVDLRTVCTIDSAAAVSYTFSTTPQSCAAVNGTSNSYSLPFRSAYNYGYTEMLYTAAELTGVDSIYGVSFNVLTTPTSYQTRKIDIYLGLTDRSSVSTSDYMPVDSLTNVVMNYSLDVSQEGWVNINFTTPFHYDGTSNLMLTMRNHTGNYNSFYFATHSVGSGRVAQWYSDYDSCSASNPGQQTGSYSGYLYITDTNTYMPSILFFGNCDAENNCDVPVVAVSGVDSTSATVAWSGSGSSYSVEYRTASGDTWTATTATASPATISGLQPGTQYVVRVVATCSDVEYTSSEVAFVTDCAPLHIPFHFTQADMMAVQSAGFSPCWSWSTSNPFYRSYIGSVGYVYCYNANSWFALPEIAEPLNTTQLRTQVASTASGNSFRVGVMESNGSITWVDTLNLMQTTSSTVGTEYVAPLDSYTGTGNRIVVGGMTSNYVYFLDFHVEAVSNCRGISNLAVSNITDNSADLSWIAGGSESQWVVYVNGTETATVSTTSYSLSGLSGQTGYTVGVRSLCGADDTSHTVQTIFRTDCGAIGEFPWLETFSTSDAIDCWTVLDYDNASNSDWSVSTYGGYAMSGYNAVNPANDWLITPTIVLPQADSITFSWDMYGSTYQSYTTHLRVLLATSNSIDTADFTVEMFSGQPQESSFETATFDLTPYAGQTVRVAFVHDSHNDNGPRIDNVGITVSGSVTPVQPCAAPTSLHTVSVDSTSAVIDWTSSAASWKVSVNGGSEVSVSAHPYTLNNLTPATQYSVRVKSVCADGQESAWATMSFTTANGNGEQPGDTTGIVRTDGIGFAIYPNPATTSVTIESDGEAQVSIIDMSGRTVYSDEIRKPKFEISVATLARGTYFVRLSTAAGTAVSKLVVQ